MSDDIARFYSKHDRNSDMFGYDNDGNLVEYDKKGALIKTISLPDYRPTTLDELAQMEQARTEEIAVAFQAVDNARIALYNKMQEPHPITSVVLELNEAVVQAEIGLQHAKFKHRSLIEYDGMRICDIDFTRPDEERKYQYEVPFLHVAPFSVFDRYVRPTESKKKPLISLEEIKDTQIILFAGPQENEYGFLSLKWPVSITYKETAYYSAAHAIYASVAKNIDDTENYNRIMSTEDGDVDYTLENAQKAKNIDDNVFYKELEKHLYDVNYAKYAQYPELKLKLLQTGNATLGAYEPNDTFIGIGIKIDQANSLNSAVWPGKNKLGKILMIVRTEFKKESEVKEVPKKPKVQSKLVDEKKEDLKKPFMYIKGAVDVSLLSNITLKEWIEDPSHTYIGLKNIVKINEEPFPKKSSVWANLFEDSKQSINYTMAVYYDYIESLLLKKEKYVPELLKLEGKTIGYYKYNYAPILDNIIKCYKKQPAIDKVSGLYYLEKVIYNSDDIINSLDEEEWISVTDSSKSRRVQHYGWKYDYKARKVTHRLDDIPKFLDGLKFGLESKCRILGLIDEKYTFDQCIINEYYPGQGISEHTDAKDYDKVIGCYTLGSGATMRFKKDGKIESLYVKEDSLYIMSGESRYDWKHEMTSHMTDIVDGHKIARDRRISVTFRRVIQPPSKASLIKEKLDMKNELITLTFGDAAENHAGMEQIGEKMNAGNGFTLDDLKTIKSKMEGLGISCDLIKLAVSKERKIQFITDKVDEIMKAKKKISEKDALAEALKEKPQDAYVLRMKGAATRLLQEKMPDKTQLDMFEEQKTLEYDTRALMRGRVVDKHARWNLCFDEKSRAPHYEAGKGTIVGYDKVPLMKSVKKSIETLFGPKAEGLKVESNYYYNIQTCGIGYHGDSERVKVVAIRIGHAAAPIYYQWFYKSKPVQERVEIPLDAGDMYVMSEKAVGADWKKSSIYTLRHATGCSKYTDVDSVANAELLDAAPSAVAVPSAAAAAVPSASAAPSVAVPSAAAAAVPSAASSKALVPTKDIMKASVGPLVPPRIKIPKLTKKQQNERFRAFNPVVRPPTTINKVYMENVYDMNDKKADMWPGVSDVPVVPVKSKKKKP